MIAVTQGQGGGRSRRLFHPLEGGPSCELILEDCFIYTVAEFHPVAKLSRLVMRTEGGSQKH
jgi:hypothetical protein